MAAAARFIRNINAAKNDEMRPELGSVEAKMTNPDNKTSSKGKEGEATDRRDERKTKSGSSKSTESGEIYI